MMPICVICGSMGNKSKLGRDSSSYSIAAVQCAEEQRDKIDRAKAYAECRVICIKNVVCKNHFVFCFP